MTSSNERHCQAVGKDVAPSPRRTSSDEASDTLCWQQDYISLSQSGLSLRGGFALLWRQTFLGSHCITAAMKKLMTFKDAKKKETERENKRLVWCRGVSASQALTGRDALIFG